MKPGLINRRNVSSVLFVALSIVIAWTCYENWAEITDFFAAKKSIQKAVLAEFFRDTIKFYYDSTILFFVFANGSYVLILMLGLLNARRQFVEKIPAIHTQFGSMRVVRPVSILVPCYNEEITIEASLNSMLSLDYPDYEIVVCNDGSKDDTLNVLIDKFDLYESVASPPQLLPTKDIRMVYRSKRIENIIVLDKANGGKADALNAAINYSQYPLICCVDSDSIIDGSGLATVALPFMEDSHTVATGGTILLADPNETVSVGAIGGGKGSVPFTWLGMIQTVEYLRAFMVGRLGWDMLNCEPIISGAFGLFKKSMVVKVGGYLTGTIGEDMELLLRIHRYCLEHKEPYSVRLLPDPVCWTEPPSDLKTLKNQRIRWTQGLAESIWHNRQMLWKPWSGRLGWVAIPYFLVFELLSAPIEVIGYATLAIGVGLDVFDMWNVLGMLSVTILFGCILNMGAIIIDQLTYQKYVKPLDIIKLILGAMLEHVGFRQFHLVWRITGIYRWLRGKGSWGEMKRVGIAHKKPSQRKAA